jgi:hypothetical protein
MASMSVVSMMRMKRTRLRVATMLYASVAMAGKRVQPVAKEGHHRLDRQQEPAEQIAANHAH